MTLPLIGYTEHPPAPPLPPPRIEDAQSVTDERLSALRWTKVSVFVVENQ